MNESKLKKLFLEMAQPLMEEYVNAALGKGELSSTDAGCREEVWSLMKQLMLQSSDTVQVKVKDMSALLTAIENGEVTLKQADQIAQIMQRKQDIEELPLLLAKIQELEGGAEMPALPSGQ